MDNLFSKDAGCFEIIGGFLFFIFLTLLNGWGIMWGLNQAFTFFDVAYVIPYTWFNWAVVVTVRWLWK